MEEKIKVLVVSKDYLDFMRACSKALDGSEYEWTASPDFRGAALLLRKFNPSVLVVGPDTVGSEDITSLQGVISEHPDIAPVFIISEDLDPSVIREIDSTQCVCLSEPFSPEELDFAIRRAIDRREIITHSMSVPEGFGEIIGRSKAMLEIFDMIRKIAKTEANVIIYGESGTGKELVARSIHANSLRAGQAFVPVDCASIPENLLESELFGHEKGAFTNAYVTRPGIFEFAHKGTLFLDEVSQLSPGLQAKLLRAVQERQFRRVGGRRMIQVDIRIIAATNRDLRKLVESGDFREDLYYRLNVISVHLPPLRERREDIPLLANFFIREFNESNHKSIRGVSRDAMDILMNYNWPGNVRELQNVVERAVSLCEGEIITADDLPAEIKDTPYYLRMDLPYKEARKIWMEAFKREYIRAILRKNKGNISRAARDAGVSRRTIHRFLKESGMEI